MTYRASFRNGRHLKAARTLAGLRQTELAALAGLHPNSVKRLELKSGSFSRDYAAERIGNALRERGVIAEAWPLALVRLAD